MPSVTFDKTTSVKLLKEVGITKDSDIKEVTLGVSQLIHVYFSNEIDEFELSGAIDYLVYEMKQPRFFTDTDFFSLLEGIRRLYYATEIKNTKLVTEIVDHMKEFEGVV